MRFLELAVAGLVPPLCTACGRPCQGAERRSARRCDRLLAAARPLRSARPGRASSAAWSSAPHEGVARDLVSALKFRRLLPVAALMAERIHGLAPGWALSGEIVPVPTARLRSAARGFDPAAGDRRGVGRAQWPAAATRLSGKRAAPAARSAVPALGGSEALLGSMPPGRFRAASCWSMTC